MKHVSKLVVVGLLALSANAGAQAAKTPVAKQQAKAVKSSYKRELPDSLKRAATVTESNAAATALAKVPNGKIESVELEHEDGKLLYSYDIKVPGKAGIEEVHVDAMTGAVIGNPVHETAATEKTEAAAEKKEKSAAAKPTRKKPPV